MSDLHVIRQGTAARTVVFLHGLEGDPAATWQGKDKDGKPFSWPEHVASRSDWTVLSIGYAATIAGRRSDMSVIERAAQLLELLKAQPGVASGSIALVTHSLGGLVAKQMVRHAEQNRKDHAWFLQALVGIVFVATPHAGSELASFVSALGAIVGPGFSVRELQKEGAWLLDLNRWFRDRCAALGIRVLTFYERQPLKLGFLRTVMVVEPSSADPGIAGVQPIALDEDHASAAKPRSADALLVKRTQEFLGEVFELDAGLAKLRRQAAAVCYRRGDDGQPEFLLVLTDGERRSFPKGNVEAEQNETLAQAAAREAEEEAGVTGDLASGPLHTYLHRKRLKENKRASAPGASEELAVTAYLLQVRQQGKPQEDGRDPRWFSSIDAMHALRQNRDLKYADEIVEVLRKACTALGALPPP